jgi:hypothetical protein
MSIVQSAAVPHSPPRSLLKCALVPSPGEHGVIGAAIERRVLVTLTER